MKKLMIAAVAVAAVTFAMGTTDAKAGGFGLYIGSGGHGHGYYGGFRGRRGCRGGHGFYGGRRWHDTSHYDYHPGGYYRHGNHFHYQPGHYDFHRTGHWDYYGH